MNAASKIQIRAQVLQAVLRFKNSKFPSDAEIENCIKNLREINEPDFVATLLLKEISVNGSVYDNILTLLLFSVSTPVALSQIIFKFLNDKETSDEKKLFLINLLREQGQKVDYEFISSHINNPDEAIDRETKKFLSEAKYSPEAQIDFFDFYFTVNEQDRKMLVDSIIDDYSGDELANILEPFAYFYPEICVDEKIIKALADSKSYFALAPLKWCCEHLNDDNLSKYALKMLNKLSTYGINISANEKEIYHALLENSRPLSFWYSSADGNSNISCVFARCKDNGFIQTFFTVFNLFSGPVACFGFDEVAQKDFNVILLRFFKSSLHTKISLKEGKAIFDALSNRAWSNSVKVPYEFICWRHLTYDVEPINKPINAIFTSKLKKKKVDDTFINKILNSDIFSSWFYDCQSSPKLFDFVNSIKDSDIDLNKIETELENLSTTLLNDEKFKNNFIEHILFQAFILSNSDMITTANILYSTTFDDILLNKLLLVILKKSIYNYFLTVSQKNISDNVFLKKDKDDAQLEFANSILRLIEVKWVSKEE